MGGAENESDWRTAAETWRDRDDYERVRRTFEQAFEDAVAELERAEDSSIEAILEFVAPCLSVCDLLAIYGLESSFGTDPDACPADGRYGDDPWCGFQLKEDTAEKYGLTVDEEAGVDEREDLSEAARAAARYLLYLGRLLTWSSFRSLELDVEGEPTLPEECLERCAELDCEDIRRFVYASYNAGEGAVVRARLDAGANCCDWETVSQDLSAEAREYAEKGRVFREVFCPPDGAEDGEGDGGEDGGDAGGDEDGGDQDGGGGGCFIATAAYGTPTAGEIDLLRAFRDDVLRRSAVGRLAVRAYYRTSPPIAAWIARSERRRRVARRYVVAPMVRAVGYLWRREG